MPVTVVIGCQWGDEGKGKIVDVLASESDLVARFQGGSNAGHTIVINGKKSVVHALPSGVLRPGVMNLVGNGMVVDPIAVVGEIDGLAKQGHDVTGRLLLSEAAHMVLPYHKALDAAGEGAHLGNKIGTTLRGIGLAYADKARRMGLRLGDLRHNDRLADRIRQMGDHHNAVLRHVYGAEPLKLNEVIDQVVACAERLAPMLCDGVSVINDAIAAGKNVLCEGAQGVMLDIDHGTYPYVTSSSPTPGGACTGLGISPRHIDRIVGVFKAYTTRVGSGPFPTEQLNGAGDRLREAGGEYGATTGRPRRCGWLDLPVVRRALQITGCTELVVMKMDVLDELETIPVCTHYRTSEGERRLMPLDAVELETAEPQYRDMAGWGTTTRGATKAEQLPAQARTYLEVIQADLKTPITMVSTGPGREETVVWR